MRFSEILHMSFHFLQTLNFIKEVNFKKALFPQVHLTYELVFLIVVKIFFQATFHNWTLIMLRITFPYVKESDSLFTKPAYDLWRNFTT